MAVQFSQHHLLRRFSPLYVLCSFIINSLSIYAWLSILFHWSVWLFWGRYHTVLTTINLCIIRNPSDFICQTTIKNMLQNHDLCYKSSITWWAILIILPLWREERVDFRKLCSLRIKGGGHATHSSILAWRIPWTEEPGGLPSMASQRVGHNWARAPEHVGKGEREGGRDWDRESETDRDQYREEAGETEWEAYTGIRAISWKLWEIWLNAVLHQVAHWKMKNLKKACT